MPVATPWIPMLPLGTAETSRWKELEHHSHACVCELWFWEHDARSTWFIIDMHLLRSYHHDNLDRLQIRWLFHSASSMHMMCLGLCTIPAWSCPTLLKGTCWREPMFCDRCNLSSSLTFGIMCPNSNHKSVADCIRTISTAGCRYCRYAVGELIHAIAWLAVRATWNMLCSGSAFVIGALRPGWLGRTLKQNTRDISRQGRLSPSSDAQLLMYIEISSTLPVRGHSMAGRFIAALH